MYVQHTSLVVLVLQLHINNVVFKILFWKILELQTNLQTADVVRVFFFFFEKDVVSVYW